MKLHYIIIAGAVAVCTLGSCTERRTSEAPVPDGDTIEVVIPVPERPASTIYFENDTEAE